MGIGLRGTLSWRVHFRQQLMQDPRVSSLELTGIRRDPAFACHEDCPQEVTTTEHFSKDSMEMPPASDAWTRCPQPHSGVSPDSSGAELGVTIGAWWLGAGCNSEPGLCVRCAAVACAQGGPQLSTDRMSWRAEKCSWPRCRSNSVEVLSMAH